MRRLTLIRHAHAATERSSGGDIARPLDERGELEAERLGQQLHALGLKVDAIQSSSAARAEATARIIAREIGFNAARIDFSRDVYCVSAAQLLTAICALDDEAQHAVLVSHNPGITELHNLLCDDNLAALPTCGVTRLELSVEHWREVTPGSGSLAGMHAP